MRLFKEISDSDDISFSVFNNDLSIIILASEDGFYVLEAK
jgi:hypothetical protein